MQKSGQQQCHISSLASFVLTTASGNIIQHLSLKEKCRESSSQKLDKYLTKYTTAVSSGFGSASTTHELNRDILIWFCRDLLPFEEVEKQGFAAFFSKSFPGFQIPTAATLSITALNDIY